MHIFTFVSLLDCEAEKKVQNISNHDDVECFVNEVQRRHDVNDNGPFG